MKITIGNKSFLIKSNSSLSSKIRSVLIVESASYSSSDRLSSEEHKRHLANVNEQLEDADAPDIQESYRKLSRHHGHAAKMFHSKAKIASNNGDATGYLKFSKSAESHANKAARYGAEVED